MNVLHLPYNVASQISILVQAQRSIGVAARGLVSRNASIQQAKGIENFPKISRLKHPIRARTANWKWRRTVQEAIHWADIVHFRWGAVQRHTRWIVEYIGALRKPAVVDFCGSDIRTKEDACAGNEYLRAWAEDPDSQPHWLLDRAESSERQRLFWKHGFACVVRKPELLLHIDKRYFPSPFRIPAPLPVSEFQACYPDPSKKRPLVLHCPSKPGIKGTKYVIQAVERLKKTHDFEFRLVHGMRRDEAMRLVQDCDVLLDQFLIGDYGTVTMEGLAMGKPVICWIRPEVAMLLPEDMPIINSDVNSLAETLGHLLVDGTARRQRGILGRRYVEQRHDAKEISRQLVTIYQKVITQRQSPRDRTGAVRAERSRC